MIRSDAPYITAIVINWNLVEETSRCLESLQVASTDCRVLLVDNGSQDGSGPVLQERFPEIQLLALAENKGFSQACNLAIRRALANRDCRFIFLLNNDATAGPEAIETLLQVAEENRTAGILGPKIYHRHPSDKIWYAGAHRRRAVLAARTIGRNQLDRGQFDHVSRVDYVFGAAMFVRREVFEQVGLFDEHYFLYLEDLDLCLRAQQVGFVLLYVPQAHIWHEVSASTANDLSLRRYHQVLNTLRFLRKNLVRPAIVPAVVFWLAVFLRLLVHDLFIHGAGMLFAYQQALTAGFRDHTLRPITGKQRTKRSTATSPRNKEANLNRAR